MTLKATPPS